MTNPHAFVEIHEVFPEQDPVTPSDLSQEHYELCLLLEGSAEYYVESSIYSLRPGDLVLTRKSENHFAKAPRTDPYKLLSVRFSENAYWGNHRPDVQAFLDSRPLGQFNLYPAAQFKDTHWKYYMTQIHQHRDNPDLLNVYLSVLLSELMLSYSSISQPSSQRSDQLFAVIAYINSHLSEPMSVESLCQRFFISRSQLNRLFRKMTGASVWDYVVAKRLMYAKVLLEAGETPASACQKCGFNDYSPFYRAYKARYGVSPRLHKQKHT